MMSLNLFKEHLVVYAEDESYKEILNGIQILLNVNEQAIRVESPCGGWRGVFNKLEKEMDLLRKYKYRFILLLMDFDDRDKDSKQSFNKRMETLDKIANGYRDRVFLLGVNHRESEDLKSYFKKSNFEEIGKILLQDCPNGDLSNWRNIHLECNLPEIQRMKDQGIFSWLFR